MKVTEETLKIKEYLETKWHLKVEIEKPLRELFPEPKNRGLLHIWKYGRVDLAVLKNGNLIAIFEPGGAHHFNDERQVKNDKRKWMLARKNGVPCVFIMNRVFDSLSNRKKKHFLGKWIYYNKAKRSLVK